MFRRFWWCAFVPAALALLALDFILPRATAEIQIRLLAAFAIAVALSLVTAAWASHSLARRINELKDFAQNLIYSRTSAPALVYGHRDEIEVLSKTLGRAAVQWQELVERLRLESTRREAILKSMAEGVLAVDRNLRVIFCNDSLAHLLGAPDPLPAGLPLLDLARDPGLTEVLAEASESRMASRRTLQLSAADGRIFEVNAAPLADSNHGGAIAILHDITDLERLERVRKDFVANVSHELRTPLTAIRGYAEALLDGAADDPETRHTFLSVILSHSIRLNNIASDLLILSELESGKNQPPLEMISVPEAVQTAIRTVDPEAQISKIRLVQGRLAAVSVQGTRLRLEQALINLLDNAIKFNCPDGSVRVESGRAGAGRVYISISDDGIGIPSEDLGRIFERFYRVDKARSRKAGGTGLGLSIVKHLVERMNGMVKVESRLGEGSTFTIILPGDAAED